MYRHQRQSPLVYRIWMTANAVVLVTMAGWILRPGTATTAPPTQAVRAAVDAAPPSGAAIPTREEFMRQPWQRFGLSAPQVPWSAEEVDQLSRLAGARPTLLQYFVKWDSEFRADGVALVHRQNALPLISWEPWVGASGGENQPQFQLDKIARGELDAYITRFATGVRDQRYPLALRFAHEMNGVWYPWSERRSGNKAGDYVRAWRHVHDIFRRVGATNVIWIWSPNILRPVPKVSLKALYPGDDYVDWVGMVGYAMPEVTAAPVFAPTLKALREFTAKPVLITETGVLPSPHKAAWIRDFFRWLPKQRDIIGFVWFEFSQEKGGSSDWRFASHPEYIKEFSTGLAGVKLTPPLQR